MVTYCQLLDIYNIFKCILSTVFTDFYKLFRLSRPGIEPFFVTYVLFRYYSIFSEISKYKHLTKIQIYFS